LLPSSVARALASSDGLGAAFGVRKPRSCFVARLGQFLLDALVAAVSSVLALSAAARPSAISGSLIQCLRDRGHTNFIVNSTRIRKTMA
jgi:hypothetical protein